MPPHIRKGNCFIFSLLFKIKHPRSKILIRWNKQSNIVSFSTVHKNKRYFYKRKDRSQSKFWFNGKIVTQTLSLPANRSAGIIIMENTSISAGSAPSVPKQFTFLENLVTELKNLNQQWGKALGPLEHSLVPRLDTLSNRLNSLEFPKNHNERSTGNGVPVDPDQKPIEGLVQEIMSLINENHAIRYRLEEKTLPQIFISVEYLEKLI